MIKMIRKALFKLNDISFETLLSLSNFKNLG